MDKIILFVNHKEPRCGVYQAGLGISKILKKSNKYRLEYVEVENLTQFENYFNFSKPDVVLYNYHPAPMPWLNLSIIKQYESLAKSMVIQHEGFHNPDNTTFQYYIFANAAMEILPEWNNVFVVGRPLKKYDGDYPTNSIPTIGSFGFGFLNKRYELIAKAVNSEFDNAIINLQISYAKYGDNEGFSARQSVELCRKEISKPGIELRVSHAFLPEQDLLKFLASNDINVFLYDDMPGRGSASTIDWALSVKRPIAVSKTYMFKHLVTEPSVFIEDNNLKTILANGTEPLHKFYNMWSEEANIKHYDEIFDRVLSQ
jgi:hypothetical protein